MMLVATASGAHAAPIEQPQALAPAAQAASKVPTLLRVQAARIGAELAADHAHG
jgi:hypothetical protein